MLKHISLPTSIIDDNHKFKSSFTMTVTSDSILAVGDPLSVLSAIPPNEWDTFIPRDKGASILNIHSSDNKTELMINIDDSEHGRRIRHIIEAGNYTIDTVVDTNDNTSVRGFYIHVL